MNSRKKICIYAIVGVFILACIVAVLLKTCGYNQVDEYQNNSENSNIATGQELDDTKEVSSIASYGNDASKGHIEEPDVSNEIKVIDSDVSKVEIGIADDIGFHTEIEPEGLASDTSMEKVTSSSSKSGSSGSKATETESTVSAETQPSESESIEPETLEPQTNETLPFDEGENEIETIPEAVLALKNGIYDYDDYEALTSDERKEIRQAFTSVKEYNAWLAILVERRNNKISEGAIGYGENVVVD